MRSCLLIERRLLDPAAAPFLARMALAEVPVVEVDLPLSAKAMRGALRAVVADGGWLLCSDAAVVAAAATAGLSGVVLIGAELPADDHGIVVAVARDVADAPRVMVPRAGGCWHDHRGA